MLSGNELLFVVSRERRIRGVVALRVLLDLDVLLDLEVTFVRTVGVIVVVGVHDPGLERAGGAVVEIVPADVDGVGRGTVHARPGIVRERVPDQASGSEKMPGVRLEDARVGTIGEGGIGETVAAVSVDGTLVEGLVNAATLVHNPGAESSKAPLMCNPIVDERSLDGSHILMR